LSDCSIVASQKPAPPVRLIDKSSPVSAVRRGVSHQLDKIVSR